MKKIVIINGHPNKDSFNFGLVEAYKRGAENSGSQIEEITIANLKFNPNLQFGYQQRIDLEPGLGSSSLVGWTSCNYQRIYRSIVFARLRISIQRKLCMVG
jgi:Flavodoxin-like fold